MGLVGYFALPGWSPCRLVWVTTAIWRFSRKTIRRVCSRMAGISEAMKFSFRPRPITTPPAFPIRAATIFPVHPTTLPPRHVRLSTGAGCSVLLLPGFGYVARFCSINCTIVSVSVSLLNWIPALSNSARQFLIVFDNPVMHHYHLTIAAYMRMSIPGSGHPMGRPAGMPDADFAVDRVSSRSIAPGFPVSRHRAGFRFSFRY